MKKTILLIALGFCTLCLTNCSRGYGCPYTTETKIEKRDTELAKNTNTELITNECEIAETEVIAD